MPRSSVPAMLLILVFAMQGAGSYGLSRRVEIIPATKPLSAFPTIFPTVFPTTTGEWRMSHEGAIEQDEKDVLRADDYLTREYRAPAGKSASLFLAYFRSQRAGQTPHSPKNCLPGSGWTWTVADTIVVNIAARYSLATTRSRD